MRPAQALRDLAHSSSEPLLLSWLSPDAASYARGLGPMGTALDGAVLGSCSASEMSLSCVPDVAERLSVGLVCGLRLVCIGLPSDRGASSLDGGGTAAVGCAYSDTIGCRCSYGRRGCVCRSVGLGAELVALEPNQPQQRRRFAVTLDACFSRS